MKKQFLTLLSVAIACSSSAQTRNVEVRLDKPGAEIPSTMYGLFFEDINYAADGGLYAEMVKNRSFEFHPDHLQGWDCAGAIEVRADGPFDRNPHYVRLLNPGHREKRSSISNEGFFGMAFRKGDRYNLSLWARGVGDTHSDIRVELVNPSSGTESQSIGGTDLTIEPDRWRKYEVTITPSESVKDGELRVFLADGANGVDLEHISLFPEDTYKGRINGMRRDIAEALEDLRPGVFRFPGGCIVEGADPATRYQWKNTVGTVENRPLNENRWQSTFRNRFYPDYFQSGGLGFFEYFQLCEDLGAEPLPVLNVGMVCQFQNNLANQIPIDSLQQYIDDAVDLIEFANGAVTTPWGKVRAEMGHPAPFGLKYLAVGNEQWGPEYVERLKPFVSALRKSHPEIKVIGSSGPGPDDDKFKFLWPEMREIGVDLVDEHFYRNEDWFASGASRYDKYPRKGPKVFAGEYACHGKGKKFNHYNAALMEAAFMTGLERNADVVKMATYAPLLAHVDGWQWRPDLIWFDNSEVARTASYYVQQIFSTNKGSRVVPVTSGDKPLVGAEGQDGLYASGVTDDKEGTCIVKVVNISDSPAPLSMSIRLPKKVKGIKGVDTVTLESADPMAENIVGEKQVIAPVCGTISPAEGNRVNDTIPPHSFRLYKMHIE